MVVALIEREELAQRAGWQPAARGSIPVERIPASERTSQKLGELLAQGVTDGDARTELIKLAVRKKQLEMDTVFEHVSPSISKLEAQLEAEKAARRAGYPIIGYVIETRRL